MGHIQDMERGTLCPMRGGRYFNHQTWEKGRNVARYVPAAQVPALRRSIAGYQRFVKLTEEYVTLIVRLTRQRHAANEPPARRQNRQAPQNGQKKAK